jgi:hypothetical protein
VSRTWAIVLGAVAVVATVAAVVFGVLYVTKGTGSEAEPATAAKCDQKIFGHVSSIDPKGDGYELRFDPAMFTSGVTANTAAAEDGVVAKGEPVPNDNYVVDESHRLYKYVLPANAKVTVLTRQGDPANFGATPITVAQLAQLVNGEKPIELFEGLDTGFWMRYAIDTVCSLDQQYKP